MTATAVKSSPNAADDRIGKMEKTLTGIVEKLSKTPADGNVAAIRAGLNAPNVRRGEDSMGSRGFSFMKMLGVIKGLIPADQARVECDISNRLNNAYVLNAQHGMGYDRRGLGAPSSVGGSFLAPLATSFMAMDVIPSSFRQEMKSLVNAGCENADPDEMRWIGKTLHGARGAKAMSWLNELTGGALVAPPEMGELIELLRNKEALVNAGARVVPLPPQGRMKYPRQTLASNTFWVGESSPITDSTLGVGEVTLQAKKLTVLIKAPNELIRFASPAAEALMRDDMTKSLALGLDLAALEGLGGDNRPLGILNQQGINTITSSIPGLNGDALVGQDIYRMVAAIEESNGEFEGYIMRPKTLYRYYQLRADAVGQGDAQGPFLFNLIREAGIDTPAMLAGFPVTKSTQVSQVRSKGNASNLSYIVGGMWSDFLIGMFGAIEFAATTMGDTAFVNDQSWIRGIISADCVPRHAANFVLLDNLNVNA